MIAVARYYRLDFSQENVRATVNWERDSKREELLTDMARQLGMGLRLVEFSADSLNPWRLPLIAVFDNQQIGVITRRDNHDNISVQFSGDEGLETTLNVADIEDKIVELALLRPLSAIPDARVDDYIRPYQANWFWSLSLKDWRRYGDIMLASLVANVLALAAMIFSMQVYDRVVPAQSYPTLWVLFAGVMMAILFEFCMRMVRTHLSDVIGKRADLRISDRVFGHALRLKNNVRSKSTGSFISQIRELESVRELITSTTIGAVADLPFFLLFVFILWMIGGWLVLVVLLALPLLVIPGLLVQRPLARLANEGMRESAVRNATLVEAVQSIEDIKLLRAEQRFQNQWNHTNDVASSISMKQRFLTGLLLTWTQEVQSIVYVVVLLVGCFMVMNGDMTTGALVGTTILASRTIAPLSQISGVLSRWQQAKVARNGLDELMKRPVDQPEHGKLVHKAVLHGNYQFSNAVFYYDEEEKIADVAIGKLNIQAGEKIAILGRNGAGKSTLLQMLAGMRIAQQGQVLLDNISIGQLDPADLRRDMGLLSQTGRLFFGSLRENLTMGMPEASDEDIERALTLSGALPFVQKQKNGLNYMIQEGGFGLSGGQRQTLLLARLLISQPNIVLLDEPSASLDEMAEAYLIEQLKQWIGHRTLIIATHRTAMLQLVDRIIVMDQGRIVMDGAKEAILREQGQPLAQLNRTKTESDVQEAMSRLYAALATSARLRAEVSNKPLVFPDELNKFPELIESETALYNTRRDGLNKATTGLTQGISLVNRELAMTQPLVKQGAASSVEVLRLQRQANELENKLSDVRTQYYVQAREELAKANAEVETQRSVIRGREDSLTRLNFTAPVRGIVQDIDVTTVGGVIAPGGKLMTIVPLDEQLLIEAKISPRDVAFIHPGQKSLVKITAYDYSIYGGLPGEVAVISPDTVQDEVRRDVYYYRVYIRTFSNHLENKSKQQFPIFPGMVATVDIRTGKKSVLDYLLKPFNKAQEALRER
ncbi:type I secretion system permease/ATPase [Escherichia coli]